MNPVDLDIRLTPFATVAGLRLGSRPLESGTGGETGAGAEALVRLLLEHRSEVCPSQDGDRFRDRVTWEWRSERPGGGNPLANLVKTLEGVFDVSGGSLSLRNPRNTECWRLLRSRFDPALALTLFAAKEGARGDALGPGRLRIEHGDKRFQQVLREAGGLAETHLHINAALTSEIAWCVTLLEQPLARPRADDFCARTFGEGGPSSAGPLAPWLWLAGVGRNLLEAYLGSDPPVVDFREFCSRRLRQVVARASVTDGDTVVDAWLAGINGCPSTAEGLSEEQWRSVFDALEVERTPTVGSPGYEATTISALLATEREVVARSFVAALAGKGGDGTALGRCGREDFVGALLQYVRVRNLFHRHLIASGSHRGLKEFTELFRRGSRYAKALFSLDPRGLVAAVDELDAGRHISAFEMRLPARIDDSGGADTLYGCASLKARLDRIARVEESGGAGSGRRAGVVFQFLKHDKPAPLSFGTELVCRREWREASRFLAHVEEAASLCEVWTSIPELDEHVIGFDVAGYEDAAPNWIYLAILRKLRAVTNRVSVRDGRAAPRFTFHAGETTPEGAVGLQRIDEVLDFLEAGRMERVGHALALHKGGRQQGTTSVRNEDWGRALCWAQRTLEGTSVTCPVLDSRLREWMTGLRDACEAPYLAFWGDAWPNPETADMGAAYAAMTTPEALLRVGFPFAPLGEAKKGCVGRPDKLLAFLMGSPDYRAWSESKRATQELPEDTMDRLRQIVLDRIVAKDVVIEACPTSNVVIGSCGQVPISV